MKSKIFDCITFFRENFISNIRFEILHSVVDHFVICESKYDHNGNRKELFFKLKNKTFKNKIIYIILKEPFPKNLQNGWSRQAYQRDFILSKLNKHNLNDYIMFSDPDEIPNPEILKNFKLKKKYGIFMQSHFVYKFNLYNHYDSPWEGTRVCKFGDLKSIDYMRQKILSKNIKKWWRPDKEKNIELITNGGWHFNNVFGPKDISIKLKTFAHTEFSKPEFSDTKVIKEKIDKKIDLYNRGWTFKKVNLNKSFPKSIVKKLNKFSDLIL